MRYQVIGESGRGKLIAPTPSNLELLGVLNGQRNDDDQNKNKQF